MKRLIKLLFFCLLCSVFACSSNKNFTLGPIKTFDPDNADIPPPEEKEENQIWDIVDMTFQYQIEKVLDLNWTARKVGKGLNVVDGRAADNVNVLDEVPNSSWYTNRHYHTRMSLQELKRGPNITDGPDQNGDWTIVRGKFEGGTTGFTIEDARGDYYLLKFDPPDFLEMGSSAEVISTKILYASGYNVPQNTVEYFDPKILQIGETAQVEEGGVKRKMTQSDLDALIAPLPKSADGKIRTMASKFVDGKPVGVWFYRGTRSDDPNDRVHHEHRRELRGLRSIASWLNDADRRAANTLAVYTENEQTGAKYIKHYLIDMGSTLGSNNIVPHAPKYGNEYLVDPRTIGLQYITLGVYVKPWEFVTDHFNPEYPSVGYYETEIFDPGSWYPTYPNPAFEHATYRDAFWGAKIVMAFTDEEIRAIVDEAKMSNPDAREYLIKTLIARRDEVGRYWFERMNPLDKFTFVREGDVLWLRFSDLAVSGNLASAQDTRYIYTVSHPKKGLHRQTTISEPQIAISRNGSGFFDDILRTNDVGRDRDKVFRVKIQTRRNGSDLGKPVDVYFYYAGFSDVPRVVGIVRHE